MMDKIYYDEEKEDMNLIYAKGRQYPYVYKDSACTVIYPSDELYQKYIDGAVIFIKGDYSEFHEYHEFLLPVAVKWIGGICHIAYAVSYYASGDKTSVGVFAGGPRKNQEDNS